MVDREVQNMIKDLEQRLSYHGLSLDQYFPFTGSSEEQMKDYMKENAERKVRTDLVLNAITDKENLEATEEELKAKAEEVVKMYQSKDVDQMVDILLKSQAEALKADVVREKIVNMLVDSAKVNK